MSEKEILSVLEKAVEDYKFAELGLKKAKQSFTDAETTFIGAKIHKENTEERLRIHYATTPKKELTLRDIEIQKFQENFPEICEEASRRELKKFSKD